MRDNNRKHNRKLFFGVSKRGINEKANILRWQAETVS
jgi:hypothetical protein